MRKTRRRCSWSSGSREFGTPRPFRNEFRTTEGRDRKRCKRKTCRGDGGEDYTVSLGERHENLKEKTEPGKGSLLRRDQFLKMRGFREHVRIEIAEIDVDPAAPR
jgi:hypothetical protein